MKQIKKFYYLHTELKWSLECIRCSVPALFYLCKAESEGKPNPEQIVLKNQMTTVVENQKQNNYFSVSYIIMDQGHEIVL